MKIITARQSDQQQCQTPLTRNRGCLEMTKPISTIEKETVAQNSNQVIQTDSSLVKLMRVLACFRSDVELHYRYEFRHGQLRPGTSGQDLNASSYLSFVRCQRQEQIADSLLKLAKLVSTRRGIRG